MSETRRQYQGQATGIVAAIKKNCDLITTAVTDAFESIADGEPSAGLPLEVTSRMRVKPADEKDDPVCLRLTMLIEPITEAEWDETDDD